MPVQQSVSYEHGCAWPEHTLVGGGFPTGGIVTGGPTQMPTVIPLSTMQVVPVQQSPVFWQAPPDGEHVDPQR